jgi:hypothetical protein
MYRHDIFMFLWAAAGQGGSHGARWSRRCSRRISGQCVREITRPKHFHFSLALLRYVTHLKLMSWSV